MSDIERAKYLKELRMLLEGMHPEDREDTMDMVKACFDACTSESEAISRLGSPTAAAIRVLRSYDPVKSRERREAAAAAAAAEAEDDACDICDIIGAGEGEAYEEDEVFEGDALEGASIEDGDLPEAVTADGADETVDASEIDDEVQDAVVVEAAVLSEEAEDTHEAEGAEAPADAEETKVSDEDASDEAKSSEVEATAAAETPETPEAETGTNTDEEKTPAAAEEKAAALAIISGDGESEDEDGDFPDIEQMLETAEDEDPSDYEDYDDDDEDEEEEDEAPKPIWWRLLLYIPAAIVAGIPSAVALILLTLATLALGLFLGFCGAITISFCFLGMKAFSDIIMTGGAGVCMVAIALPLLLLAVLIFLYLVIGLVNKVLEWGNRWCYVHEEEPKLPDPATLREGGPVVTAMRIVFSVSLVLLLLGGLSFGLSMLMGANLRRIADVVFGKYDLVAIIKYIDTTTAGIKALFQ